MFKNHKISGNDCSRHPVVSTNFWPVNQFVRVFFGLLRHNHLIFSHFEVPKLILALYALYAIYAVPTPSVHPCGHSIEVRDDFN